MRQRLVVEKTLDGSDTLFVPEIDEYYHSIHGAKQESTHIFITAGLNHIKSKQNLTIFEVGFGTGLNALLTLEYAQIHDLLIKYYTVELYPVEKEIINQLNYNSYNFKQIHNCSWNEQVELNKNFTLFKSQADFSNDSKSVLSATYDLIFFDAFSPDKQPEMWTQEIFDNLYKHTQKDGVLCTYCAKGIVRRMLIQAGYVVERLPGPPGKREMLRATK